MIGNGGDHLNRESGARTFGGALVGGPTDLSRNQARRGSIQPEGTHSRGRSGPIGAPNELLESLRRAADIDKMRGVTRSAVRGAAWRRARTWSLAATLGLFFVGCESGQIAAPKSQGVVWTRITSAQAIDTPIFPDWRGDSIVFHFFPSGLGAPTRLGIIHSGGSGFRQLVLATGSDRVPRWADDHTVTFASNRSSGTPSGTHVWAWNTSDGSVRQLTTNSSSEWDPAPRPGSPGLAYVEGSSVGVGRLTLLPDTALIDRVYLAPVGMAARDASWDPTGTQVCFSVDSLNGTHHIWRVSLAAGDSTPVQLTTGPYNDRFPRFSPDGTRILFSTNRTGRTGIWWVAPQGEGTGLNVIAFGDANTAIITPTWSPDGKQIVISTNAQNLGQALWVLSNLP